MRVREAERREAPGADRRPLWRALRSRPSLLRQGGTPMRWGLRFTALHCGVLTDRGTPLATAGEIEGFLSEDAPSLPLTFRPAFVRQATEVHPGGFRPRR